MIPHSRVRNLATTSAPEFPEPDLVPDASVRRLNLNESPLPPSPRVIEAVSQAVRLSQVYPDHTCGALAARLAASSGIPVERITFGNGSGELLTTTAWAAVGPGDEAVMPAPTFPTCGKGVRLAGGQIVSVPLRPDGVIDGPAMVAAITPATRLVYVCTPNNPTGGVLEADHLERLVREVPAAALLAVDEAYYEFGARDGAPDVLSILQTRKAPWVVTRTFSKAYSLAGLRVGYAYVSDPGLAAALWQLRANFNVARTSLAAACAAFDDGAYSTAIIDLIVRERERLAAGLRGLGCDVYPSSTNFVAARPPSPAASLVKALAAGGILIQAMPWPDEKGSLRITVGDQGDTEAVLGALATALKSEIPDD
jgi:histidinol-phosphate aminotransferase